MEPFEDAARKHDAVEFPCQSGDYPACAEAWLQGGARLFHPDYGSEAVQAVLQRHAARS